MEFNEVLRMRQSVRRYTEEKVSAEDIQAILTAAQHAPVGMHNSKGYVLTVISSETVLALMKKNYKEATGKDNDPIYGAPLFLLVSKTPEAIEEIAKYDAACLIENMHLAACRAGTRLGIYPRNDFFYSRNQRVAGGGRASGKYRSAVRTRRGTQRGTAAAASG